MDQLASLVPTSAALHFTHSPLPLPPDISAFDTLVLGDSCVCDDTSASQLAPRPAHPTSRQRQTTPARATSTDPTIGLPPNLPCLVSPPERLLTNPRVGSVQRTLSDAHSTGESLSLVVALCSPLGTHLLRDHPRVHDRRSGRLTLLPPVATGRGQH